MFISLWLISTLVSEKNLTWGCTQDSKSHSLATTFNNYVFWKIETLIGKYYVNIEQSCSRFFTPGLDLIMSSGYKQQLLSWQG